MSNPSTQRLQHLVPSLAVLVLAGVVAFISWTQEPADVFVFPRLVSVFFVLLALWNAIRAVRGLSKVGDGFKRQEALNILPGVLIMVVLVYGAAKFLGFYAASSIAFLGIATLYDPAPFASIRAWLMRIAATVAFMGVIYLLFAVLLRVQTPRGLFF
ncbi:MAG: tripartite tricarboxylate transporter TctB family protein [Alphaproteobacteria bacterium]|jgi:hypothetical protein